jgi:predicted phage terminase large subunit-like protein
MEFEPERCCTTVLRPATATSRAVTFVDPRTEDGELLFPERYPQETVTELKAAMSAYAWAGQMQQRPSPRGGAMLRVDQLEIVDGYPAEAKLLRAWDLAGTKVDQLKRNDPDWTRGALCAFHAGIFYIVDVRSIRATPGQVEALIKQTAVLDGYKVPIRVPQDPGAAGKAVAEDYVRNVLPGWPVHVDRETGDKVTRAQPFVTAVEHGNVKLVRGEWVRDFLEEAMTFPFGRHDDQIDAVSAAHVRLTQAPPAAPLFSVPLIAAIPIDPQAF